MAIPLGPGDKALTYALGGVMRGGVGRAGAVGGQACILIDGVKLGFGRPDPDVGVLIDSLDIRDELDETPNTCSFRVNGTVPATGAEVVITLGSYNRLDRLFAGYALTVRQRYASKPINVQADVQGVDYTWLLGFVKVTQQYRNTSAAAVIRDLVQTYAGVNGFTTQAVHTDLDGFAIDELTFTDEDLPAAITRTVRRAGAYWYVDYLKDVHAFRAEASTGLLPPLVPTHHTFTGLTQTIERTQALTRVSVEGRGSRIMSAILPGETRLPVRAADMFEPGIDVFAKLSFSGAAGGAQHIDFTGAVQGGVGTLVGPGNAPSTGPTVNVLPGGSVNPGAHEYAFTWLTAAGETRPSPLAWANIGGGITAPTGAPGVLQNNDPYATPCPPYPPNGWRPGDAVEWAYCYSYGFDFYNPSSATPLSLIGGPLIAEVSPYHWSGTPVGSNAKGFKVWAAYSMNPSVGKIFFFHRINGGPWFVWSYPQITNYTDRGPLTPELALWDANSSAQQSVTPPVVNPAPPGTVKVDGIATGPTTGAQPVTGRKVYRSKANITGLFYVATIANNTASTYTDTIADSALGAAAPVGDTSAIPVPAGTVNAGAPQIVVASIAPFDAGGGWALVAGMAVRYTGISFGNLIGIPLAGIGSLTGPVSYDVPIEALPMLIGIPATGPRSISQLLDDGGEIYVVVQVDDLARADTFAAALHVPNGTRQEWIQDRRLSVTEARARALATLALRPIDAFAIDYTCRDLLTAAGKAIHVDLPAPTNVLGDYKLQAVTIRNFRPHGNQYPTYTVRASSAHFTFEDWLNRVRTKE